MATSSILSLLAAAGAAYLLARPHLAQQSVVAAGPAEQTQLLHEQRERCLQVLKDLELDYHTGKVSEADYRSMKLSTSQELSALLKSIDEHSASRP